MQHSDPIQMSTNEIIDSKLNYTHQNSIVAGFVDEPEHWKCSSAIDYSGGKGLIDIVFLE